MPTKVSKRIVPSHRGKKVLKVYPLTPVNRTGLPAAPAGESFREVWESAELRVADIPLKEQGVVDTIRMQAAAPLSLNDMDRLKKAGWKPITRRYAPDGWISPDGAIKIEVNLIGDVPYTSVEGSVPRVFGLPNTEVPSVGPQAFVDAVSALTWKLLPETTTMAMEQSRRILDWRTFIEFTPRDGLSAVKESKGGCLVWAINRIDLARNFVGPVRQLIRAYANAKVQGIRSRPSLERGLRNTLILKAKGKRERVIMYEKDEAVSALAQKNRKHKAHVQVLKTIPGRYGIKDPNRQQFGRIEWELRNADSMRNFVASLLTETLFIAREGDPLILLRFHTGSARREDNESSTVIESPATDIWVPYRALHRWLALRIQGLGSSVAVRSPFKNLSDVAIEAMAGDPSLFARYLDGGATPKSKANNAKKVEGVRLALGRAHPLWSCYSDAEISELATLDGLEGVRDEKLEVHRLSLSPRR